MKLTQKQIDTNTDLWLGKLPNRPRQVTATWNWGKGPESMITELEKTGDILFEHSKVGNDVFLMDKYIFKLLNSLRIRHLERYVRGDGGMGTCFNFLGGVNKKGILEAVIPIQHKLGCMYFSPVEPSNFLAPMYELQVNGFIPKVLIRITMYTVKESTKSRVDQILVSKNNPDMVILSFGVHGTRAENRNGNMKIQIV